MKDLEFIGDKNSAEYARYVLSKSPEHKGIINKYLPSILESLDDEEFGKYYCDVVVSFCRELRNVLDNSLQKRYLYQYFEMHLKRIQLHMDGDCRNCQGTGLKMAVRELGGRSKYEYICENCHDKAQRQMDRLHEFRLPTPSRKTSNA